MILHLLGSRGDNGDRLHPTLGFVTACPRLNELTVILPYPRGTEPLATRDLLDPARRARSTILQLITACKVHSDFDTLQIVRFPLVPPFLVCRCGWGGCGGRIRSSEQQEQALRKQTKDLEDWAIDCLKKPERRERKTITLRVLSFRSGRPCNSPAKVDHEV